MAPLTLPDKKTKELLERYEPLPVSFLLRYSILRRIESSQEIFSDIQGRERVKDDVVRALLSGAHPYLISEEGTGKTRLARSITNLLFPIPRIKGCPYNDDPKWPKTLMCPRCGSSNDPVGEFGVEWVTGADRFSRIQGNEYTNEAKLLGLKDIQAIAQGMSPRDPLAFSGTGVFHANRGILFIDELPAIRTKVQVLLHPIIEEKKAILEEYNWEYPLDLVVIATGNPEGFSHVNEVPRPLLDRLETIYMDFPDEDVEFAIMLGERFGMREKNIAEEEVLFDFPTGEAVKRNVVAPWWMLSLINKSARHSRICRWLDKKSSIRGTTRAIDHTFSSTEMARRKVVRIGDIGQGMKLALRGRVQLRQDLVDYDNPRETTAKIDAITEDLVRNALFDLAVEITSSWNRERVVSEVERMTGEPPERWPALFADSPVLCEKLQEMETMGRTKYPLEGISPGSLQPTGLIAGDDRLRREYVASAAEFMINLCVVQKWLDYQDAGEIYVPRAIPWAQKGSWL